MIWVSVGSQRVSLEELRDGWLVEQIKRQSAGGQDVCVRVDIEEGDIRVGLTTPACSSGAGGGRPARPREAAIIEQWRKSGLTDEGWTQGNLIAFLKQLPKMV